jgi:hypothetical protein
MSSSSTSDDLHGRGDLPSHMVDDSEEQLIIAEYMHANDGNMQNSFDEIDLQYILCLLEQR